MPDPHGADVAAEGEWIDCSGRLLDARKNVWGGEWGGGGVAQGLPEMPGITAKPGAGGGGGTFESVGSHRH